jgi:sterol 3beta-glucosyltransferase
MERVVLLALGLRGDVEPFIALASALQAQGYETIVAALKYYRDAAISAGVRFCPIDAQLPAPDSHSTFTDFAMANAHRHQLLAIEAVQHWMRLIAPTVADAILRLVQPSDVVITGILTLESALALRATFACPIALVLFAPCLPTSYGASLVGALLPRQVTVFNRWSGIFTWRTALRWSHPNGGLVQEMLGHPRQSMRETALRAFYDTPLLLATSSQLVPRAADWPPLVQVTGPLGSPARPGWSAPYGLTDYLRNHANAVFLGFGSVGRQRDIELFIAASSAAGVPIVVGLPPGSVVDEGLNTPNAYLIREVPHSWLFPQMAGVIHHGASGTTSAGLLSGVPSAAIPHEFDQRYFAHRLSLLKVGPKAVSRRRLNRDILTAMLKEIATGQSADCFRTRAVHIGSLASKENGVSQAILALRASRLLP